MITLDTFFIDTEVIWKACKEPRRTPDFVSASGSKYWYGENKKGVFVVRKSDHWCKIKGLIHTIEIDRRRVASCRWHLKTSSKGIARLLLMKRQSVSGKAYLKDFKRLRNLPTDKNC